MGWDFEDWWRLEGEQVEAGNTRRDGQSGVQRLVLPGERRVLYIKRQIGHLYRSLRYPLGRPTILREHRAYLAFQKLGILLPKIVFVGAQHSQGQWRALLVTEALEGFRDMESWYDSGAYRNHSDASRQALLAKLAQIVARFHRAGWQFGGLYPKHVFLRLDEQHAECALLDLEGCRKRWNPKTATRRDLDQLYRHRGLMPDEDWAFFKHASDCAEHAKAGFLEA
jgi:hypothetical protein